MPASLPPIPLCVAAAAAAHSRYGTTQSFPPGKQYNAAHMEEMDIVAKRSRLLSCSSFFYSLVTLVVGEPIMAVRPRDYPLPSFFPSPSCLDNFTVCVLASSTLGNREVAFPMSGWSPNLKIQ